MKRYALRVGEPLAIDSAAIRHDADGFYLMMGDGPAPENETRGEVTIVNVRGALTQFRGDGGDSYEAIQERVAAAFDADPKPTSVLLRISSPGGVVAGLNECVFSLQRMSKAAKIPLVCFVDELAASAAFALACACSERLTPPSGIVGSIGVISTMVSVAARDKSDGIEFRLITSGKRKADGHLHAPLSDDAEKAERARNEDLAAQFFDLASKALKLPAKTLAGYEAAIFLGKKAKKAGLVDDIMSLDAALFGLGATEIPSGTTPAPNEGNITDRRAKDDAMRKVLDAARSTRSVTKEGVAMAVKLSALIRTTEAAIAAEADPRKKTSLLAKLAAFSVAKAEMDDDDDDDDDKKDKDDGEGDDESKSAKHAENARKMKAKAKALEHRAKASEHKMRAAESEEEAKKCEEEAKGESDGDEEEKASASPAVSAALAEAAGGGGALGVAMAELAREVGELKASKDAEARAALIAKAKPFVPPHMLAAIKGLGLPDLKAFVATATKGEPMVMTSEDQLVRPRSADPTSEASLPIERRTAIDLALLSAPMEKKEALRAALVAQHLKDHNEHLKALNGGSVRY
jgi:ClpP class serine protease